MRVCACGCGQEARPNGKYANDACRARAWRERTNYVHPRNRSENGENGAQKRNTGRTRSPDMRISYLRAVGAVTDLLDEMVGLGPSYDALEHKAHSVLRPLLSDAARDHLAKRS